MKSPDLAAAAIERGAVQHAGELAELVEFLLRRPLQQVLEIGVYHGGTLWLWRRLVGLGDGHAVVGVDVHPQDCDECDYRRAHNDCPRVRLENNVFTADNGEAWAELIVADSQQTATRELVRQHFPAGVDLLHIDADHGPGVWRDFELYSPLVKTGGVTVLHDVTLADASEWPPAALWKTLRDNAGAFTIAHDGGFGFGVLVAT